MSTRLIFPPRGRFQSRHVGLVHLQCNLSVCQYLLPKLYILLLIFCSSFNCIDRQKRMIDGSAGLARFPSPSLTFWRVFWEPSNLNIINTSKKTFYWSSVWILREDRTRFKKKTHWRTNYLLTWNHGERNKTI